MAQHGEATSGKNESINSSKGVKLQRFSQANRVRSTLVSSSDRLESWQWLSRARSSEWRADLRETRYRL